MAQNVVVGHRPTTPALGTPSTAESPSRHEPGETIAAKYRLIRRIGRGGMGEVWAAQHLELKTDVAIKICDEAGGGDRELVEMTLARFRFEAQVSARLGGRTKHVVAAHDVGMHEERPFLVMELVQGTTLDQEISTGGPLTLDRLAAILDQIAEALHEVHALDILHRDLKPSNIMLTQDAAGRMLVKLTDFGVAKALRGDETFDRPKETAQGFLVGSPAYMSPEQLRGTSAPTIQSDLWALGVAAYESLTGWTPFSGDSLADLIVAISTAEADPPSSIRPSLPRAVDGWFERALAKEPADRFASAEEMAAAFRVLSAKRKKKRSGVLSRHRLWLAAAACVALGFVTVAAMRHAGQAAPSPSATAANAAPTSVPAPTLAPAQESTSESPPPSPVATSEPPVRFDESRTPTPARPTARRKQPAAASKIAQPTATAQLPLAPTPTTPTPTPPPSKEFDKSEIQ